jgi:hypothetical protein
MATLLNLGLGLFAGPLVLGFLAALVAVRRFRIAAPIHLTGAVLFAYGALVLYQGLWALSDWNGSVYGDNILRPLGLYNEDERRTFFKFTALVFAIPAVHAIVGVWAAALLSRTRTPALVCPDPRRP